MDDPALPAAEREAALRGLERISAWPGQRLSVLEALERLLGKPGPRLRLIEVGAGSGHLSRWLDRELKLQGFRVEVFPTDRVSVPGVGRMDALKDALPEADIYFSNLMLHHLDDADLSGMLQAQCKASRLGFVHLDLHRHPLHYYGASALIRAAGLPKINLSDGLRSIQQGYTSGELLALAPQGSRVRWHFPFRWALSWQHP